ncbi:GLYCTK [Bugula neritina]|uniref:GLYCTK n=1 Tax=Bugula neritina TaxID=10212 RepID=A0A7J7JW15_BUGNE|nr:GLYCTK [Bugula neritina]
MSVIPVLLTSQLCGNATQVGRDMAELAKRILNTGEDLDYVEGLFEGTVAFEEDINNKIKQAKDLAIEQNSQVCVLFGGETTVEVTGTGRGGRNQEMCLSAMIAMDSMNLSPNSVTFASIGTDGQDGPTSAAGAVVAPFCSSTSQLDPLAFLKNNDSHSYFSELEGGKFIYNTGLTGTNVMDIGIMLLDFEDS